MHLYSLTTDKVSNIILIAQDIDDAEKQADRHCELNRQKFYGLVEMGDTEPLSQESIDPLAAEQRAAIENWTND